MKTGIVGCGKVAGIHADALIQTRGAELTGVCDNNYQRAEKFAENRGVTAFETIQEMVDTGKIDVVTIATPHPSHAAATIAALQAGAHVLVEKPLASSLEDCDAMIEEAQKRGKKLGMISQRRFYEPVRRIKEAIETGKIGRPILSTVTMLGWRDQAYYESDPWRGTWAGEGGGVLVNQAPHQLDIMQWYMGPVEELYGLWANLNHPYIEVEDTAIAIIRFRSGAIGNILVSNSQNPALYGQLRVHGESGASLGVQTDGGEMFVAGMSTIAEPAYNDLWTISGEEEMIGPWRSEMEEIFAKEDPMVRYHRMQIEEFLSAVEEDREPLVDGAEGRKTVEIFTAIYRSTLENGPIRFPLT